MLIRSMRHCFSSLNSNDYGPCEKKGVFWTISDKQTTLLCETLVGENINANMNRSIGKISLNDIPPLPKGQGRMEVTFRITMDKTLHVIATNLHNNNSVSASYPLNGFLI